MPSPTPKSRNLGGIAKEQHGIIVPSACSMGVPTLFCWDNNDLLEETLSGTINRFA